MTKRFILAVAILFMAPLSANAVSITEDFETAGSFVFNNTELSGMKFNTGGSTLSIITDVLGNKSLLVLGGPNPGDGLLRLDFVGGPVAIVSTGVSDATFAVAITAYDTGGFLLGTSTSGGLVPLPDFQTVEISRSSADIAFVTIQDSGNDFFLDDITWYDTPGATPVPESASLLLLGSGVVGLSFFVWRKTTYKYQS